MVSGANINNALLPVQKDTSATMELVCVRLVGKGHNVPKLCVLSLASQMGYVGMVAVSAVMDMEANGATSASETDVTAVATAVVSTVGVHVLLDTQVLMSFHHAPLLRTAA
eukprot:GILJ01015105.1.p2 GENE.GILJ01015105.1~~GILJ01015105.1.p2  ORF type:complete len:111 (+),score=18.58 GILJ01015105.1:355-687(+)